jgi:hypothetical protein
LTHQKNQIKNKFFKEFAEENNFIDISNENVFNQDTKTIYINIKPVDSSLVQLLSITDGSVKGSMEASCISCAHDFDYFYSNADQQFEMPVMGSI